MALDILDEKGTPLDRQTFSWRDMVRVPFSKLDDDALTRVRVILMNGIEAEAIRFQHVGARMNKELRVPLAKVRRVEQHQRTFGEMAAASGPVAPEDHHRLRTDRH